MRILSLLALLCASLSAADTLRVLTFNVRYPNPEDGANIWENRREQMAGVIRDSRPDLIGTQELFKLQGDYLASQLPAYAWFGRSRRGNDQDEYMGVFYRKDKLRLLEQGDFWLSETPSASGSMSWDVSLPRMVTWGLFETTAGLRFYFLNTHFAHRAQDEEARRKSAEVIARHLRTLPKDARVILTGDFNTNAGGAVQAALTADGLRDTRGIAAERSGPDGTGHGFSGTPGDARIDWIMVSPGWSAVFNRTLTVNEDGRYPSDHFPVLVELEETPLPLQ